MPWRKTQDPYAIWVSEVMLQQTRVSVVIPYFLRWMKLFPTIEALAAAEVEEVIKAWEGLGYYSRARNLHKGAKQVLKEFSGRLPADQLEKITGIGPYTAGAIAAFAFRKKAAAIDGNVLRVIARYLNLNECIAKGETKKKITNYVESILPDEEPWLVTEALIELGATHCAKKAQCSGCPLQKNCQAYHQQTVHLLPKKEKKTKTTDLFRAVFVITDGKGVVASKEDQGKVMADLYQFPYLCLQSKMSEKQMLVLLEQYITEKCRFSIVSIQKLEAVQHGFTRFRAFLFPFVVQVKGKGSDQPWVKKEELCQKAFSAGHKKILNSFLALADHI